MKPIRIDAYGDVIRQNCLDMINAALKQPALSTKFNMSVDLKDILPVMKGNAEIVFSAKAYAKMLFLVDEMEKEVAVHGTVFRLDPIPGTLATFFVDDIFVYPQEAAAATVESNDEKYGPWLSQLPDAVFNNLRFQAHSHVNMGVRPSGTDEAFYSKLLLDVQDFYIFMIINKSMCTWAQIMDITNNVMYETDDILTSVIFDVGDTSVTFLEEIKKNVIPKVYAYAPTPAMIVTPIGARSSPATESKDSKKKNKCPSGNSNGTTIPTSRGSTDSKRSGLSGTNGNNAKGTNSKGARTIYNPDFGKAVAEHLYNGGTHQ